MGAPERVIMAVENLTLREALLEAIEPLDCSPELIAPTALFETALTGDTLVFIETSNDVDRLISTIKNVWAKWGETECACINFLSYSTEEVTPDSVVFQLWSIGPELTVIVQVWHPERLAERQSDIYNFTCRWLRTK